MKPGFVTDSASDIPVHPAEQCGIGIVPTLVTINRMSYADGLEISREEFYTRLQVISP
jgi:fatty acid-binding protein DegV